MSASDSAGDSSQKHLSRHHADGLKSCPAEPINSRATAILQLAPKSVYTSLAIGTYTAQVYAQAAPGGTATGVILDPGGWGEAILATEF
jgi:hypothetical protein